MAELIAVGKEPQNQIRLALDLGETTLIGRAPRNGWSVPWDRLISREHARVCFSDGMLQVEELSTARNPILLDGVPTKAFTLQPDEVFRIGDTTFYFRAELTVAGNDSLVAEHVFGHDLGDAPFANPLSCLEALCKMPKLIARASTDDELAEQVVELLLDSLRGSLAAAVMQFDSSAETADETEPQLIRWNSRGEEVQRFRPSRRLIRRALDESKSVVHLWMEEGEADSNFTMNDDLDWAFCTPIPVDEHQQWCLYVSGRRRFAGMREVRSPQDLMAELKLAELMAQFIGAVRRVRSLEQHQTEMRQFFSPAVVETLANDPTGECLEPRLGPVSVLFCDVRGFSRKVEDSHSHLHDLLDQVSLALSVMTRSILKYEGVIADFQGDAALGFWGWPSQSPEASLLACRAALLIHNTFREANENEEGPLQGFHVGIGVGHGEAITGRIGAEEQIKVGVFGPVVNLASRLQDLTKLVGVPLLIDSAAAEMVRETMQIEEGQCRAIAKLLPAGLVTPVDVYTIIPASFPSGTAPGDGSTCLSPGILNDELLAAHQEAVDAFTAGDWQLAHALLGGLPAIDKPATFLRTIIDEFGGEAPVGWRGYLKTTKFGTIEPA